MGKIIGRFNFKETSNGNLAGHFSNNLHSIVYAEDAQRLSGNGFIGQFNSSWTDDLGTFQATLEIALKINSQTIYTLHWINGSIEFFGEGFIIDNILIGDYRNFSII